MFAKGLLQPLDFPRNQIRVVTWRLAPKLPVAQSWLARGSEDVLVGRVFPKNTFNWHMLLTGRTKVDVLLGEDDEGTSLENGHCIRIGNVANGRTHQLHERLVRDLSREAALSVTFLAIWVVLVVNNDPQLVHDKLGSCPPSADV